MQKNNIRDFTKGWIIGDFEPALIKTKDFEICVKTYKAGDKDAAHFHKIATEYTIIAKGKVKMQGNIFEENDIVTIEPSEVSDFEALEDTTLLVVKLPSEPNDKYLV